MLLEDQRQVVCLYVLNHALLLAWGLGNVALYTLMGAERMSSAHIAAYAALPTGALAAAAHLAIYKVTRWREEREARERAPVRSPHC